MRGQTLTLVSILGLVLSSSAIPLRGRSPQRFHHHHGAEPAQPSANVVPPPTPSGPSGAPPVVPLSPAQPSAAAPSGAAPSVPSGAPSAPSAVPAPGGDSGTFQIQIQNNCPTDLSFGIFQVSSSFAMNTISAPVNVPSGGQGSIAAPFQGVGMRLSATASAGAAAQWGAQALFEFGFSTYSGMDGTAYDLSVMGGDTGIAVYPENPACPSKVCNPGSCSSGQGWTDPGQVNQGSPADTVCYHGKTNFRVVWCP